MSKFDRDNILLREQLGKGPVDLLTSADGSVTAKDYYAVYFPVATELSGASVNGVAETKLHLAYPAGATLFMRITSIRVASGLAICYTEHDYDVNN
tara:strand:+ start:103 stop:390 length:288 start_codon:yes stop_codon:yes gene_type:complete